MSGTRCTIWIAEEDDVETVARIAVAWIRNEKGELSLSPQPMDRSWGNQRGEISSKIIELQRSSGEFRVSVIAPALIISLANEQAQRHSPKILSGEIGMFGSSRREE